MKTKGYLFYTILVVFLALAGCSKNITDSGGGSETVWGKLVYQDGSAVNNVALYLRPSGYAPDEAGLSKQAKMLGTTDSVSTNSDGTFGFDSVEAGKYVIYGSDTNGNAVLIQFQVITEGQDIGTHFMKPFGSLKGKVVLSEGGDPRKVPVVLLGVNRWAFPDTAGNFGLDSLAEGAYTVRLQSTIGEYDVLDKDTVVYSGQETDVGSLAPKYNALPTPKNFAVTFDSLKQIVVLTWDSAWTSNVTGYNIYRSVNGQNFELYTQAPLPVGATAFYDTIAMDVGTGLEYRLVSRDNAGRESRLMDTDTDSVAVTTVLKPVRTISLPDSLHPYCFTVLEDSTIVAAVSVYPTIDFHLDSIYTKVVVMNNKGVVQAMWGEKGEDPGQISGVHAIAHDDSNRIYLAQGIGSIYDPDTIQIQQFDLEGNFLKIWKFSGRLYGSIVVLGGQLYAYTTLEGQKALNIIDATSGEASRIPMELNGLLRGGMFRNDAPLLFYHADSFTITNATGSAVAEWPLGTGKAGIGASHIAVLPNDRLVVSNSSRLQLYRIADGELLMRSYQTEELGAGIGTDLNGNIYYGRRTSNGGASPSEIVIATVTATLP